MNNVKRLVIVLSMVILTGCAVAMDGAANVPPVGQVWGVTLQSTLGGILDCINQEAGTAIIAKDSSVIFEWRMGSGWAFSGFNTAGQKAIQEANLANYSDGSQVMQRWVKDGWKYIDPRNIPQPVMNAIAIGFARIAGQLTTFAVFPIGTINPEQYGVIPNPSVNQ